MAEEEKEIEKKPSLPSKPLELSLIHISSPRDAHESRMPSSA